VQGSSWKVRIPAILLDFLGICSSARQGLSLSWGLSVNAERALLVSIVLGVELLSYLLSRSKQAQSRQHYVASLRTRVAPVM
jgi:hypothetical protein